MSRLSSSLTKLLKLLMFIQAWFCLLRYQSNIKIFEVSDWDAAIQPNQIGNHCNS